MKSINSVTLAGKISHVGALAYTPTGVAVMEFRVAATQKYFDRESVGYFDVLVVGDLVNAYRDQIRIGRTISIEGSLWMRSYRNRQGNKVVETKVLAESIGGNE